MKPANKPGKAKPMDAAAIDKPYQKAKNLSADRERTKQGTATAERIVKAGDGFEKNIGREGAQRIVEAPLDRLEKTGAISRSEFDAGNKFRGDAYLSAVDPTTGSIDWTRAGGGGRSSYVPSMFEAQHVFDARIRYREIEKAFNRFGVVWALLHNGLIHEHSLETMGRELFGCGDKREAAVAGRAAFRTALAALADRYANGEGRR